MVLGSESHVGVIKDDAKFLHLGNSTHQSKHSLLPSSTNNVI